MPTKEEGHAAHLRGQDDALAGVERYSGPWRRDSDSQHERALASCYGRGYNYGRQLRLQRLYGPIPTA